MSVQTLTSKTNKVSDIHGDQIRVDGQWFHAERIFGKSASEYFVGQIVDELLSPADGVDPSPNEPDELVSCSLYRGCSSNIMDDRKTAAFVQAMLDAGGWGDFPMIAGYVETLDEHDVEQCASLVVEGRENVWLDELGWSRLVTHADIGTRYVQIDNGHHRMAAAAICSDRIGPVFVPVADIRREEDLPRFASMRP